MPLAFIVVFIIILIFIAVVKQSYPTIRGNIGEAIVARRLSELPNKIYKVINNIMLPTIDGATTQVDHIVVSRFGIFVIETKDYSGWIFCSEKQSKWTQVFPNSERFYFQNPIKQNWRHIYAMSDILKLPRRYFFNIVVFCGDCEFRTDIPENVIDSSDIKSYIKAFDRPLMSDKMVDRVVHAIAAWDASVTNEQKVAHVSNLHAAHDVAQLSVLYERGELKCPRCGAAMVLRHRKSDNTPFYGCSKYPVCKGIRVAMA